MNSFEDHKALELSHSNEIGILERLPLYENFQPAPLGSFVLFELPEATPEEVRRFLAQLLIENRGLSVDDAGSIASKWARGSGKDLVGYPPRMFFDIFGQEDGYMVYKETHLLHRQKLRENKDQESLYPFLVLLILIGLVPVYILNSQAGSLLKTFATFLGIAVLVVMFAAIRVEWHARYPEDLEDQIHRELRSGMDSQNRSD